MPVTIDETVPYTMRLPGGRTVFVNIPAEYVEYDISGEMMFTPEGVRFLDRIQVLAMKTPDNPTRGYLQTVREALGMTQAQLAQKLERDVAAIQEWEKGKVKPDEQDRQRIQKMVDEAGRRGVIVAA
jgi:DNA-binding XRE family transcriptional regulator